MSDHLKLEEIRKMLWLLIKTEAIDLSTLTNTQRAVINRIITSWSEEWQKVNEEGIK